MFNLFRKSDKDNFSPDMATRLIAIINKVKSHISDVLDMTYCYYETPGELIQMLDKCISEIEQGNMNVIDDLAIEFAPTSSLQEHSLCNGWSDQYLIIAEEFDSIQMFQKK